MMKQVAVVLVLVVVMAIMWGCGKAPEAAAPTATAPAPAGPTIKAVFGTTVANKPIDHAIAKKNGENEVTIYAYSFKTTETWPGEAAYAADDFFVHLTIRDTAPLRPGEYTDSQIVEPGLSSKTTSYGFMRPRGSVVITEIANGKIKGEFRLDDGYVKVSGPFEMDLV
jgi:hypothetical protein